MNIINQCLIWCLSVMFWLALPIAKNVLIFVFLHLKEPCCDNQWNSSAMILLIRFFLTNNNNFSSAGQLVAIARQIKGKQLLQEFQKEMITQSISLVLLQLLCMYHNHGPELLLTVIIDHYLDFKLKICFFKIIFYLHYNA